MSRRIKVVFSAKADSEVREAIAVISEMWGTVYRGQEGASLVILLNGDSVDLATAQVRQWETEGALTWTTST